MTAELNPKDVAQFVGKIEKDNYFAHSIRKIEREIFSKYDGHYHIVSRFAAPRVAKVRFYDKCCEIILPRELQKTDDKLARIILAHELGHVLFNIDRLENPEVLNNAIATDEEEAYAWEFAFYLVLEKSKEYREHIPLSRFTYTNEELKNTFSISIKSKITTRPNVYALISKSLGIIN